MTRAELKKLASQPGWQVRHLSTAEGAEKRRSNKRKDANRYGNVWTLKRGWHHG